MQTDKLKTAAAAPLTEPIAA